MALRGCVSQCNKQGTCMASSRLPPRGSAAFQWAPPPDPRKGGSMESRTASIYTRVTPQEKQKIARTAKRCGLSLSEYIRQRCLDYAPRELPSEDLFWLCEYLRDCQANATEQDAEFTHGIR